MGEFVGFAGFAECVEFVEFVGFVGSIGFVAFVRLFDFVGLGVAAAAMERSFVVRPARGPRELKELYKLHELNEHFRAMLGRIHSAPRFASARR